MYLHTNLIEHCFLSDDDGQLKAEYGTMAKTYNMTMEKIWRDINTILREYLVRTTSQRHHYIELKHLDDRNTTERLNNERRITRYRELFQTLKSSYDNINKKNEGEIQHLKETKISLNKELHVMKQNLTISIRKDEKNLRFMTTQSNNTVKHLREIIKTGNSIENFITCCKRLETETETIICWAKIHGMYDKFEENTDKSSSTDTDINKEIISTSEATHSEDRKEIIEMEAPQTFDKNGEYNIEDPTPDETKEYSIQTDDLPDEYDTVKKMDSIWWYCNRVEVECMELKNEKQKLIAENQNMKQIIKNILRDAALEPPPPKELTFPVRSLIKSAPPYNPNKIDMHGLSFLVVDISDSRLSDRRY